MIELFRTYGKWYATLPIVSCYIFKSGWKCFKHWFFNQLDAYEFQVAMTKKEVSIVVVDQYVRHFSNGIPYQKNKKAGIVLYPWATKWQIMPPIAVAWIEENPSLELVQLRSQISKEYIMWQIVAICYIT